MIIKIFVKTVIRIVWCGVEVIRVLTEGLERIFEKLSDSLTMLDRKADNMFERKKED